MGPHGHPDKILNVHAPNRRVPTTEGSSETLTRHDNQGRYSRLVKTRKSIVNVLFVTLPNTTGVVKFSESSILRLGFGEIFGVLDHSPHPIREDTKRQPHRAEQPLLAHNISVKITPRPADSCLVVLSRAQAFTETSNRTRRSIGPAVSHSSYCLLRPSIFLFRVVWWSCLNSASFALVCETEP